VLVIMAAPCIVLQDARSRLKDSNVSATELREVFKTWFKVVGDRRIDDNLAAVSADWPARGMPTPSQLVQLQPLSLVQGILKVDPTLHPRHSRLVTAIVAEHGVNSCFGGTRGLELEGMLLARLILAVLRKYRDLAKYSDKWTAICKKASADERDELSRIVESIDIPSVGGRTQAQTAAPIEDLTDSSMTTAIVPYAVGGNGSGTGMDDLDALHAELGLLFWA
jgi:hypothetical protein